jgi:hypothetical protein
MTDTNYMRDGTHIPGMPVPPVQLYNALFYFLSYSHCLLPALAAFPAYPPPMGAGAYSPAFGKNTGTGSGGFLFQPFGKV